MRAKRFINSVKMPFASQWSLQKNAYKIAKLPKDSTFGYADSPILSEEYVTTAKALERLQKKDCNGFWRTLP